MDFDAWKQAVDSALRSQGKSFGTRHIDPALLLSEFQSGVSPVVFAQTQSAASTKPFKNVLKWSKFRGASVAFFVFGFLFWAYAGYLLVLIANAAREASKPMDPSSAAGAALATTLGVMYLWPFAIAMFTVGGLSHFCGIGVRLLIEIEGNTR